MIKVVEVISDTNIGGAGVLLLNRLEVTDKKIFDETVVLPKGSKLTERLKKLGIRVIEFDGCKDRSFDIFAVPKLCTILKKLKPDILNAHGALSGRIAALMIGVPVKIYTRHCVYPIKKIYKLGAVRLLNGFVNRILSDRIIAVADSAKQNLVDMGISKNRISVIINGAQGLTKYDENARALVRKSLGIPQNATVVTICARLEKCKDHLTFLNAAALICKKTDAYRFLIIGGGSLASTLSTLVKHLSIENKVIFTGFVNDVSPYMNITDVNVNCSVGTETSSLALSEGMSLGIPAVASDYGGNPYMVKNGQNGYIYPQRNAYELSKSILALEDKELYKAMSTNAKERFFTELNAKSMTRKTEALYKSLLNSKSVRL